MPRMPRPSQEVVIPTPALVASAVRYDGKSARIYQPRQDWQKEAYRHYSICGEARFAAAFFGQALSRAVLKVARKTANGPEVRTSGRAHSLLEALFNGKDGQAQMLNALGVHLTIAGECYLVGRTVENKDVWEVISVMEMSNSGETWTINYGDGHPPVVLTKKDVIIRIWQPNPAKRIEADSPFRSLLPILTEIEWLTRHIFAQTSSRLAGAGLLFLPQDMTFPPPPVKDGEEPPATTNEADAFMLMLADAMLTPIKEPDSPSAMVPPVILAPADSIDKAKLMHFWSELDDAALTMRQEAIHRFALGMDLPPEQVTGMSSNNGTGGGTSNGVSHWGAWQIEESTIKFHIEPMLELVCNALIIGYIRPLTNDVNDLVIFDTSALRLRPDRSKEAFQLYDRGALSKKRLLEENGFNPDNDMMDDEEFKQFILRKIAGGSATPEMVQAALALLGVTLPIVPPTEDSEDTREARPSPSLVDHPTRPRTPGEGSAPPPALVAASEGLVFRALERAGNRIRQATQSKPPGVPSYEMHTLHECNGSAEKYLEDAWSCAGQVLAGIVEDPEVTVQTLNAYCLSLMAEQQPHTRERLTKWLARTAA
jgi:hypothetical protein